MNITTHTAAELSIIQFRTQLVGNCDVVTSFCVGVLSLRSLDFVLLSVYLIHGRRVVGNDDVWKMFNDKKSALTRV